MNVGMKMTMKESLSIFLLLLTGVSTSGYTACILRNGTFLIIPRSQICCENIVKERKTDEDCCIDDQNGDSRLYQKSTTLCCDGVVHPRYTTKDNVTVEHVCCKRNSIPYENKICCRGVEHVIPEGGSRHRYSCCGENLRQPGEICCRNNPLSQQKYNVNVGCCRNATYDRRSHWCQGGVVVSRQKVFCENKMIDLTKQSCCENTINNWPFLKNTAIKDTHRGCCGIKAYNKTTDTCCYYGSHGSYTIRKESNMKCCGPKGPYNKHIEICCNGHKVLKMHGDQTSCCGKQSSIAGECCNGHVINRKTHKCCAGSTSIPVNGTCCGKSELKQDSLCCKGIMVLKKTKPDQDSCCLSYSNSRWVGQPYNSKSKVEICHYGKIRQIKGDGSKWCGIRERGTRYFPEKAVCCLNRLYPFPQGVTLTCCGVTAIDAEKQTCHNNIVFNVSKQDLGFHAKKSLFKIYSCNGVAYKSHDMSCCGITLYKKGRKKCCGGRVIATKAECCNDIVLPPGSNCCREKVPFNPEFQECDKKSSMVKTNHRPTYKRCPVKQIKDSFSWMKLACNGTYYVFIGTIRRISDKRKGYQTITFKKVKWLSQSFSVNKVKLKIQYKKWKLRRCVEVAENTRVVIFTSIEPKKEPAKVIKFNSSTNKNQHVFLTNFSRSFRWIFRSMSKNNLCERGLDKYYV